MSLSFSVFPPSLSVLIKVSESCANTSEVPWKRCGIHRGGNQPSGLIQAGVSAALTSGAGEPPQNSMFRAGGGAS